MRNMLRRILIPFLCLLGLFCTLQAQDAPALGGSHVQVADLLPQRQPAQL